MSIFSGMFRPRDKPVTDSTTGSSYRFLFGGSTSGKMVTERTSMQMIAVAKKKQSTTHCIFYSTMSQTHR